MPALIAALMLLVAAAPAGAAPHTPTEREVAERISAERVAAGLAPVRASTRLARAADAHAARLYGADALWHRTVPALLRTARARWTGEVLARAATPADAHLAWLRSAPHAAVLGDPRARRIGVARTGSTYVVQLAS